MNKSTELSAIIEIHKFQFKQLLYLVYRQSTIKVQEHSQSLSLLVN
jgi:transcription initiation factor IIE alpha subunit